MSCIRLFMYNVTCTHFSEIKNYLSIYKADLLNHRVFGICRGMDGAAWIRVRIKGGYAFQEASCDTFVNDAQQRTEIRPTCLYASEGRKLISP